MGAIASIEDLYRVHARLVFAYLLRRTRDEHLAADLLQDTFVTATQAFLGWSGGTPEGWLLSIARSRLVDYYRRRKEELPLPAACDVADPLAPAAAAATEIEDVLGRLRPDQARLLQLVYVDGFRASELAAMTGQSEGSVRMAVMRARDAFRAAWTDSEETTS